MLRGSNNGAGDAGRIEAGENSASQSAGRMKSLMAAGTNRQRRRMFALAVIMLTVILTAAGASLTLLYRAEFFRYSDLLRELARGEARLILTAVAAKSGPNGSHGMPDSKLATLADDLANRLPMAKFGDSGEFMLVRRQGDQIILSRRGDRFAPGSALAIPMQSDFARPARLALMGKSGIMTVVDYAGMKVLAAYEPIPGYGLAAVAKVDMAEVQAPFLLAGIISIGGLIVFLVLVIGGWRQISLSMMQRERTARQLFQSEARLRRSQRIAKLGGWQYNFRTDEFSATDETYRLFDLTRDVGDEFPKTTIRRIHPDDQAETRQIRAAALKDSKDYEIDYRISRPDGTERYIHEQGTFDFDPLGERLRLAGVVHDVTERRQTEERLRQQAQIFDQIHDGVVYTDTNGTILSWNKGAERQSGYGSGEAIGRSIDFVIAPEDKETFWNDIVSSLFRGGSKEFDCWLRRRSGEIYRGHTSSAVVRNPEGRIIGTISCTLDITEQFRTDNALRASQERLAGILRMAPEAVITIDTEQHITFFSDSAERIFGYAASDVLGQPLDMLIPEELRERHAHHVASFAAGPDGRRELNKQRDISGLRKDGSRFPALASISKLHLENETVFTVLLHDISDRKEAEQALIEAKHQAEIANRTKSEFLANMSHELRTPLNAILGFSQMMMAGILPENKADRVSEYATDIFQSGSHLLDVINDLLDLAKIEAGHTELEECEVDIAEVVASSFRLVESRALNAGLRLDNRVPDELPLLWADERKLKQVVLNLLSNAVKFTPENGEVEVSAGIDGRGRMALSVRDTGKGMTAAEVEIALQPFGQIDNAMTRQHEGTGLGLPLSQSLCQSHGGDLEIDSAKGVGTTVSVYLPQDRIISSEDQGTMAYVAISTD